VGGFNPELGMVGGKIAYGEETALLRHIHTTISEALIYYEPKLYVYHLVRPEKMTWRWLIRDRFVHGGYEYQAMKRNGQKKRLGLLLRMVKSTLALAWNTTIGALLRDRSRYPYIQIYWYESALKNLFFLGSYYKQYQCSDES
jgi:hypothetical protein